MSNSSHERRPGPAETLLREATTGDAAEICGVYNPYVLETTISFEEEPVSTETMQGRIADVTARFPWLVAILDDRIAGYAYATPWRPRSAYRHSVETTVYLSPHACGRGIGSALYRELFEKLRAAGVHQAIGGIALPNQASVALHERLGFQKVAHFEAVGRKFDQWIDVAYWQRPL